LASLDANYFKQATMMMHENFYDMLVPLFTRTNGEKICVVGNRKEDSFNIKNN
jgi:predicted phosphoadenosine phosphosulfate sulfurtransferase